MASSWRPAASIAAAIHELNTLFPDRSKGYDGVIGDAKHQARLSDHNPDPSGVVHAFDVTQDVAHGVQCHSLAAFLAHRQDHRIRYVIFDGMMMRGRWSDAVLAGKAEPWIWEAYHGTNQHHDHMHVSIGYNGPAERDTARWWH